jgi:hypothetical protein
MNICALQQPKFFQDEWFFCCAFVAISWGIISWLFSAAEKVSG